VTQLPASLDRRTVPDTASKTQGRIVWEQFTHHRMALVGGVILIAMYAVALVAGSLAPYGKNEYRRTPVTAFLPPTQIRWIDPETGLLTRPYAYDVVADRDPVTRQRVYAEDTSKPYFINWFVRRPTQPYKILGLWQSDLRLFGVDEPARVFLWGTNNLGKDVFSRVLYGGQVSLTIGLLAVWVSLTIGLVMGSLAGFYGGRVDDLIMRLVEVFAAIPGLFLLIVLATLLKDPRNPLAQAFGASETRIMFRHLLPATASYVIVSLTLAIPGYILAETGPSFIGLGPSEVDSASWGILLRDATARGISIQFVLWLLVPGIPIFLAMTFSNLASDGLRDAFDPRKRR